MSRGTDFSNYQPIPSDGDIAALKAAGQGDFAVVGNQWPGHGRDQIAAFRAGGIPVTETYMESNPGPLVDDGIATVWIAIEAGSGFTDEASIDVALAKVAALGREAGFYTSAYQLEQLGLAPLFELGQKYAGHRRWYAGYDGVPSLAGLPPSVTMKQYQVGTIAGMGYELDQNYREDAPVANDANHADDYDIGLERLQLEAMLRVIRDEHKRAGGDPQVLKDIIDGTR